MKRYGIYSIVVNGQLQVFCVKLKLKLTQKAIDILENEKIDFVVYVANKSYNRYNQEVFPVEIRQTTLDKNEQRELIKKYNKAKIAIDTWRAVRKYSYLEPVVPVEFVSEPLFGE